MKTTINVYGNTDFQFAYMINMKLKHQFSKKKSIIGLIQLAVLS